MWYILKFGKYDYFQQLESFGAATHDHSFGYYVILTFKYHAPCVESTFNIIVAS